MLVLQSEWQALYDQAGEETDEKVEKHLSQGDLESDGMEATDDERIPLGDSDGFLTVLSRHGRMKQRMEAAQDDQGERDQEEILLPLPPPQASSDMMDRVDPGTLCQHLLDRVPPEQFEGAMQSLATSLLQAIAGKAHERGILDEAAGRAFVDRFVQQG